jgi:hypothetical protein
MRELQTDYLVIGAGASAMAFVDTLLATDPDVDVIIVDRRGRPGGHWLDAYSFVRLHQPSANYGVDSRTLGHDRIDTDGPNAGWYERASSFEICDYFGRVMDEHFLPSGRVRFLATTDYRGEVDGAHRVVRLLDGEPSSITVRRRLVDATYIESTIPSRHRPAFEVDEGVRLLPPNDLVDLDEPPAGFTILGCGKTAMDTVNWLLDAGVDPDRIRWFRPRDPWLFDRALCQPLDLVGSFMSLQAGWVSAAAGAEDGRDFAHRLEAAGVFHRIDPSVEPEAFRGPTASTDEVAALRSITRVERSRRVRRLANDRVVTDAGDLPAPPGEVYVDCTAAGVPPSPARPVFAGDRITLQYTTIGYASWSAATIGAVEALGEDDEVRNRLGPPLVFTGRVDDILDYASTGMQAIMARGGHREVAAWNDGTRLNPAKGATDHFDDPQVAAAFGAMGRDLGAALENLARRTGAGAPA